MKKERSNWTKFRRLLAKEYDCNNTLHTDVVCDYDYGHQGMHAQHLEDGVWVWSYDKKYVGFLRSH